ncbi:MAG: FixH family protein [Rhodospirillales bacterium]
MMRPGDRLIPWIFAAGFGVVVAVNAVLIVKATASFTGLETARAYDRGLAYNAALAAAERQARLGWNDSVDMSPRAGAGHDVLLEARFAGAGGTALTELEVRAVLARPVKAGLDQNIVLTHRGNGVYRADAVLPAPGQWDLRIVAYGAAGEWQDQRRFHVP